MLLDLYEKDLARVHVGQQVEMRTERARARSSAARVAYIDPVIDEETRTANVRIEFDNPKGKLRPGQFVTARSSAIRQRATAEVLAVPRSAVQRVDGKPLVFVADERRASSAAHVELGVSGGELVEIARASSEGDEVATDGAFLLKSELLR